jgi:hypothetical protein
MPPTSVTPNDSEASFAPKLAFGTVLRRPTRHSHSTLSTSSHWQLSRASRAHALTGSSSGVSSVVPASDDSLSLIQVASSAVKTLETKPDIRVPRRPAGGPLTTDSSTEHRRCPEDRTWTGANYYNDPGLGGGESPSGEAGHVAESKDGPDSDSWLCLLTPTRRLLKSKGPKQQVLDIDLSLIKCGLNASGISQNHDHQCGALRVHCGPRSPADTTCMVALPWYCVSRRPECPCAGSESLALSPGLDRRR